MPLVWLRWLVLVVVLYAALQMLKSARVGATRDNAVKSTS
jgi:hypothetical protein